MCAVAVMHAQIVGDEKYFLALTFGQRPWKPDKFIPLRTSSVIIQRVLPFDDPHPRQRLYGVIAPPVCAVHATVAVFDIPLFICPS